MMSQHHFIDVIRFVKLSVDECPDTVAILHRYSETDV